MAIKRLSRLSLLRSDHAKSGNAKTWHAAQKPISAVTQSSERPLREVKVSCCQLSVGFWLQNRWKNNTRCSMLYVYILWLLFSEIELYVMTITLENEQKNYDMLRYAAFTLAGIGSFTIIVARN